MPSLTLRDRIVSTDLPALIMGIVNCTSDSFYAESRGDAELAQKLIAQGADILDLGAESTRPGAAYVSAEEEIRHLVPVITQIRKHSDIPISVDTRKLPVMKAAFEAGADIVNDISALEDDPGLGDFAARHELPVILMHKRGTPGTMQSDTRYTDVFAEVSSYLTSRAAFAENCGVRKDRIIVDPGVGFGKTTQQNEVLVARCGQLCEKKYTVLMALSRKTMIGDIVNRPSEERLWGTLAANLYAVLSGASVVRVHDVAACRDTLAVWKALQTQGGCVTQ